MFLLSIFFDAWSFGSCLRYLVVPLIPVRPLWILIRGSKKIVHVADRILCPVRRTLNGSAVCIDFAIALIVPTRLPEA